MRSSLPTILALALLSACATQPNRHGSTSFRPAIESANRELMARYNRGDMSGVARMYEDDAVMISSRGERYQGRAAIDAYWNPPQKPSQDSKPGKWTLEVLSVEGTEFMPVQRGRSILEGQWEGKATTSDVQFVVVWRKQPDGSYRISVDSWWPTEPPDS